MQTPQKGAKQASKWGNFFQQAVAGVESRLDTILAENENDDDSKPAAKVAPSTSRPTPNQSMKATLSDAQKLSSNHTPRGSTDKPRHSLQQSRPQSTDATESSGQGGKGTKLPNTQFDDQSNAAPNGHSADANGASAATHEQAILSSLEEGGEPSLDELTNLDEATDVPESSAKLKEQLEQLRGDYEAAELRRQEEVHSHMERIDALQSKLQYLSRQAADTAKEEATSLPSGSLEKKLAEKEEQIALLMDEGQSLSVLELKQSTTIKKLRSKTIEDERALSAAKLSAEKSNREMQLLRENLKTLRNFEKHSSEQQRTIVKLEKDSETLRDGTLGQAALIKQLYTQLASLQSTASETQKKENIEALQKEKSRVKDLQDDLSNAKIEKELSEERLRAEVKQTKEYAARDQERARALEIEIRAEQAMLESKLEAFRVKAEEVSSGVTGDAHAKLLRQIETLQSQYAVANENWQGIENSMSSRINSLEKERDDLVKREADLRRKIRTTTSKSKRTQDDLEVLQDSTKALEQDLDDHKQSLDKAQKRAQQAEETLVHVRAELAAERQSFETKLHQRLDEEKLRLRDDGLQTPTSYHNGRPRSPNPFSKKPSGFDTFMPPRRHGVRSPSVEPAGSNWGDRPTSRRASTQPFPRSPDIGTPHRTDSLSSIHDQRIARSMTDTPSITVPEEDYFEGVTSPHSPHMTIEDVISVSTGGAGPSVQLVERMSATVRRLESEKAASKEELARLTSQRDAAREEVVGLMREVDDKRTIDSQIKALEIEKGQLDARYQTTLEMLGEKSERVEELQADVVDMKKIYRELLDSTMK
ncbi:MAG: hypothetical protein M1814_003639 [Vezdaea aestivalis]|nr:MAG: hypothetical protein M1814_003639 [Vezdaea aestivalis]